MSAYDAATVVLAALRHRREGETLQASALRNSLSAGLQQAIAFDRNGDTERKVYFTRIQGGRYVKLAWSVAGGASGFSARRMARAAGRPRRWPARAC